MSDTIEFLFENWQVRGVMYMSVGFTMILMSLLKISGIIPGQFVAENVFYVGGALYFVGLLELPIQYLESLQGDGS